MKFGVVYASTEGQTQKIARFVCDELIDQGHSVELCRAADAGDLDPKRFDGMILGASLHIGRYQKEFCGFVKDHSAVLNTLPTLFLAVSLCAAGDNEKDWRELDNSVFRLTDVTGWKPGKVEHVAGAFRFSQYNFCKYWTMRWIEEKKDSSAEPGKDHEYTNWESVKDIISKWVATVQTPVGNCPSRESSAGAKS